MRDPEFPVIDHCLCYEPEEEAPCGCDMKEKFVRSYLRSVRGEPNMPPMTEAQRAWCLDEISSVEGYSRADYESSTDKELARGVLYAWVDFCRDKGLL
jgi:hypothetical protein